MCVHHEIELFLLVKPTVYLPRKDHRTISAIFLSFSHYSLHSPLPSPLPYLFLFLHSPFLLYPFSPFPPPFSTLLFIVLPPSHLTTYFLPPLLLLSDPLPQGIIPPLVVQCVAYINRDSVLREQGLFRIPGDVATIRRIRSDFVRGVSCVCQSAIESHLFKHTRPRGS